MILDDFVDGNTLQAQYDAIYSYFKWTTEPFDFLEWDGEVLEVWNNETIVEKYTLKDLVEIIFSSSRNLKI